MRSRDCSWPGARAMKLRFRGWSRWCMRKRRLAHHYMSQERTGHTLQTTVLVHEAYQRLIDTPHVGWNDRTHFFAVCAQLMRRILVDHARSRGYLKRGGGATVVSLDEAAE